MPRMPRPTLPALLAATLLLPAVARADTAANSTPPTELGKVDLALQPTTSPAPATDHPTFIDPDAPLPWTVEINPVIWYVAPSGKVSLPVTSGTGPASFTTEGDQVHVAALGLDHTRLRPAGDIRINAGDWRFAFAGADYSVSNSGTARDAFRIGAVNVAAGDPLTSSFQLGTYELNLGYRILSYDFQSAAAHPASAVPVLFNLYALAGIHLYNVKFDIASGSSLATTDEFFAEPLIGARAELELTKGFGIAVQLTGGFMPLGNHHSSSIDIQAAFDWRPLDNLSIQIGYRQLAYLLQDGTDLGKFKYDGRIAGLFTGVVLRF